MFVAINYITCDESYVTRFESLFASRRKAIDAMPGFIRMCVLKPDQNGEAYQVISFWESPDAFLSWRNSPAFLEGHARAFADMKKAADSQQRAPMQSTMKTFTVIVE